MWALLLEERASLLTHNYVLLETTALLQNRIGIDAVDDLHRRLSPVLDTFWVAADEHTAALIAVIASKHRAISLVDRVSFYVMRRLEIDRAFTFDEHFASEGFALVA